MKNQEEEIDLFDEFKIKPITKGLGFHEEDSKEKKALEKKKKYNKVAQAFSNSEEFGSSLKKENSKSQLDSSHLSNQRSKDLFNSSPLNSIKKKDEKKEDQAFSNDSLLDRQFKEMNQIMETLSASYHSLKKSKQNLDQETLPLDLESIEEDSMKKDLKENKGGSLNPLKGKEKKINSLQIKEMAKMAGMASIKGSSLNLNKNQFSKTTSHPFSKVSKEKSLLNHEKDFLVQRREGMDWKEKEIQEKEIQEKEDRIQKKGVRVQKRKAIEEEKERVNQKSSHLSSAGHFSLFSFLVDFLFALSLLSIFLMGFLTFLKVDFRFLAYGLQRDIVFYLSVAILCASTFCFYLIFSRSFFGSTLGEWIFNFRLGSQAQRQSAFYPLLILWRILFIFCTGVFLLPVLSFFLRKDILFYFTGLRIYKK